MQKQKPILEDFQDAFYHHPSSILFQFSSSSLPVLRVCDFSPGGWYPTIMREEYFFIFLNLSKKISL